MEKKGDLSDFECEMVAGARWAGVGISETADPLRFSHKTPPEFKRTVRKK